MPQLDVRKQFHFGWGELGFMISVEDRGVGGTGEVNLRQGEGEERSQRGKEGL